MARPLSILIYHRVKSRTDSLFPGDINRSSFEWQMRLVKRWFNVLPLTEAIRSIREGRLPRQALAITFDDGYADNYTEALPVLSNLDLPATFFVSTGFLGGGIMWNDIVIESVRLTTSEVLDLRELGLGTLAVSTPTDRRLAVQSILGSLKYMEPNQREDYAWKVASLGRVSVPGDLMMSPAQVRGLHEAGMEIGAHTIRHPILTRLDLDAAREEIVISKRELENITGCSVDTFAYPNGRPGQDYSIAHVNLCKEIGFCGAVSTAPGVAREGTSDLYQLPRFTPWDSSPLRFFARLSLSRRSKNYDVV